MAQNDFNIGLVAGLDGTKSKEKINQDIDAIQKSLKELELKAKLNPNQVKVIEAQLNNLKVNLTNVSFDQKSLNNLVSQINNSLQGIKLQIPNLNTDDAVNQAQQVGKQIGQQIQNGMNSAIQKSTDSKIFKKEFTFSQSDINKVAKEAEEHFKGITNGVVTVTEQLEKLDTGASLKGFTVNIKNAKGEVESLKYALKDMVDKEGNKTGQSFQYIGGSINDNGVIKQMNAISTKADSLQTKLDKLKANYSDINASRPIKSDDNLSALYQQYDKVSKAIESVRNADSATFSSMVSNAQKEITTLETMVSQFKNAENVATQMKSVDISSGIEQAQERLGKLKANASGFEQMKQTIVDLDTTIASVGDKSSLDYFINKLKVAESQLGRVKAETKQLQEANKIQLLMGANGDTTAQIEVLRNNFTKLGLSADEVKTKMSGVDTEVKTLQSLMNSGAENSAIVTQFEKLQTVLTQTQNNLKQTRSDFSLLATEQQRLSLANTIEAWNQKNTAATRAVREENERYVVSLRDLNTQMTRIDFNKINNGFKQNENSMRTLNRLGASLKDQMQQAASSFTQWISVSSAIMGVVYSTKQAVSELKDVDTYLTEISKANDQLSKSQLKQIGNSSFDVSGKYGKKATDYLSGVQEASRAGYVNAEGIAELSVAAQGAGDMTAELANQYIIATDKAYKFGGSVEKLTKVLDGSNYITNHNAVNMTELAEGMSIVGSQAASLGVGVDQTTAALGTMIATTQQSGSEMARAFKAILLNIQQVSDEEEGIDAEGLTKYEKACNALNVSLKETKNGVMSLRDPMEVIKDLSEEYVKLDANDIRRTNLLSSVGGKLRANALNALLENYDMYSKMLEEYSQGTGSMAAEAEKTANSWEGSMNRLSNTWTKTIGHIANSDAIISAVNGLNSLLSVVDKITGSLGSLGTIGLGAGIFAGFKNIGRPKMFGLIV